MSKKEIKSRAMVLTTRVTLPVSEELRLLAKKFNMNLSQLVEEALLRLLADEK